MEKFIKNTRVAMMLNANSMIKQPLVTLNSSVHEVPSQSFQSFGDHESKTGKVVLSTRNDKEVVKIPASRKEGNDELGQHEQDLDHVGDRLLSKSKPWADQVEEDEVSDSEDQGDEGDSLLSCSSSTVPKNNIASSSPKRKLSPLAPVFVSSSKAMISVHDRELFDALESPKS